MPRRARIRAPGIPLHIIQRGNNRAACFYDGKDYRIYLQHLAELSRRFECAVHAYVLMTNHVHLLVTGATAEGPSLLMKHLGQRYVQYVNRTYGRSGTLWEGRFRSSLVQDAVYLLVCHRYIELNPVRAGMVPEPAAYAWSSHRTNAGLRDSNVLTPHAEYVALGPTLAHRADAYRKLFDEALPVDDLNEVRSAVNGGFALGSPRFKREIESMLGKRVERTRRPPTGVPQVVCPR